MSIKDKSKLNEEIHSEALKYLSKPQKLGELMCIPIGYIPRIVTKFTDQVEQSAYDKAIEVVKNAEEYIEVTDNDTHHYQIPKSKKDDWDTWCEISSDDEASWDVPEYAERVDGMGVSSFKDIAISEINKLKNK